MYDKPKIIVGVVLFLVVFTIPFWYSQARGEANYQPTPDVSQLTAAGITQCVESPQWMAAHHMQLLNEWRNDVVREGKHTYTSRDTIDPQTGAPATFEISLEDTCLVCHNKVTFCDQCHKYVGVSPDCWHCHNGLQTPTGENS